MKKRKYRARRGMALVLALMLFLNSLTAFAEETVPGTTEEIVQEQPTVPEAAGEPAAEAVQLTSSEVIPDAGTDTTVQESVPDGGQMPETDSSAGNEFPETMEPTAEQPAEPEQMNTYTVRFQTGGDGSGSIYAGGQLVDVYSYTGYVMEGESFYFQAYASEGSEACVSNAEQTGANEYAVASITADTVIYVEFRKLPAQTADPDATEDPEAPAEEITEPENPAPDTNDEEEKPADDADVSEANGKDSDNAEDPKESVDINSDMEDSGSIDADPDVKNPSSDTDADKNASKEDPAKAPDEKADQNKEETSGFDKAEKAEGDSRADQAEVPAAVQAFLDAVARLPKEITQKNLEKTEELVYGICTDTYEELLGHL